jgi:hypothetical protein
MRAVQDLVVVSVKLSDIDVPQTENLRMQADA